MVSGKADAQAFIYDSWMHEHPEGMLLFCVRHCSLLSPMKLETEGFVLTSRRMHNAEDVVHIVFFLYVFTAVKNRLTVGTCSVGEKRVS